MKKKIIIAVIVLSVLVLLIYRANKQNKPNITQTDDLSSVEVNQSSDQTTEIKVQTENKQPKKLALTKEITVSSKHSLDVPFAPQAPLANWDTLHEEACEEASFILVDYFWQKKGISPELMEKEIISLTDWEQHNGYSQDITIEELAKIAQNKYGYSAKIDYQVTQDKIKQFISEGKPVIVPLQGQDIGNPYYKQPGPPYHMLVITGYDKDEFITNDVGTKRGKGYRYKSSTLIDAIHNWTGSKNTVREGKKVMLVIEK